MHLSEFIKDALLTHTFTENILNKSELVLQFEALAVQTEVKVLINPVVYTFLIMNFFQMMEEFSIVKHLVPNHAIIGHQIIRS